MIFSAKKTPRYSLTFGDEENVYILFEKINISEHWCIFWAYFWTSVYLEIPLLQGVTTLYGLCGCKVLTTMYPSTVKHACFKLKRCYWGSMHWTWQNLNDFLRIGITSNSVNWRQTMLAACFKHNNFWYVDVFLIPT